VVLEITERSSLAKMPDVIQRMRALRALGFRIAIDDLGAGYAGLNSFTTLEPDVVKLDMGLVRGLDSSSTKQKVIRMIVALCKELGIEVIAEGIETTAERDALIGLGADRFQGYLFAKPGKPTPAVSFA
jgi:EAL domain-containing protein (putative c-di-GMP-specific phosphodiesterase class I)